MTETTTGFGERVRIEVFLRSHASATVVEPLRETVTRARRLEETRNVDVRVKTWATVRPALEVLSDSGPSVSLTVDSFRSWADEEGDTLRPAFERRETASLLDRRPAAEIRVPTVCVAVYEDGDLECVAPCSDGDRTYSVEECLAALEDGVTEPFPDRDGSQRTRVDDRVESRPNAEEVE